MIQKEENAAENILTATIRADWMADHKKQANQYLMMAHFKAILQDYPEMIN
jgi:meiotically up-regulated gene 157 (Mug157) protein